MTLRVPLPSLDRRIQRIAELMDVGVILLSGAQEVDFASLRAQRLLGLSTDREEGWDKLVERLSEALDNAWGGEAGRLVEIDWATKEAPKRLSFQIYGLDEDECEGYLLVVRDRSVQRALEADLALAAQLRNLSRLYLGLAHDLRSPLNAIVLNLELLKRSLPPTAAAAGEQRQGEWISVLEQETKRLGESLDRLLAQTIEPKTMQIRFDLNDAVNQLAQLLGGQAMQQKIELRLESSREPVPVFGRRDRIQSALLNIAVNGLEAMTDGGRLELACRREAGAAIVTISDTGPGIPATIAEQIFDLHFTSKSTGTGIGLFVARSAVQADGGSLEIAKSSASGTVFVAHWPLAAEEESNAASVDC